MNTFRNATAAALIVSTLGAGVSLAQETCTCVTPPAYTDEDTQEMVDRLIDILVDILVDVLNSSLSGE